MAYAQQVFRGRVEFAYKEIVIENDDGRGELVDDICRPQRIAVAAGTALL